MPLPQLSAAQVTWVAGEVAKYIEHQRNRYAKTAAPLSATQRALLQPFFVEAVLDSARLVVLKDSQVENPPLYSQLEAMGFDTKLLPDFADMGAVTSVDVIVSNGPISTATLFHELVTSCNIGSWACPILPPNMSLDSCAAAATNGFPSKSTPTNWTPSTREIPSGISWWRSGCGRGLMRTGSDWNEQLSQAALGRGTIVNSNYCGRMDQRPFFCLHIGVQSNFYLWILRF
jgi:hypothetical protein